jgi:anti-anti-sigma factor
MSGLAQLQLGDEDGVTIASVKGEIDLSNAAELETAISHAVANEAVGLVVDLAEVDYLDSSGVTLLFNLSRRVSRRQQEFVVVVPGEAHVREILTLSGATDALELQDTLPGALSQLQR